MFRMKIFIAGSEFLCSRNTVTPAPVRVLGGLAYSVDEALPRVRIAGLERVVVALDPRPDDEVGADVGGQIDPVRS